MRVLRRRLHPSLLGRSRVFWMAGSLLVLGPTPAMYAQNLVWSQADSGTIFLGKDWFGIDTYNSGRLLDLLMLSTGSALAASETRGVWLALPNGSALPLSNSWDRPDINTLAFGLGNEKHVFAGGASLHVTDYNSLLPYFSWLDITPPASVLRGGDRIYKIVTVTHGTAAGLRNYVVIATSRGIWSSELPPNPAGPYNWQQASGNMPRSGFYSGLAAGLTSTGTVVAGPFNAMGNNPSSSAVIWRGTFDSSGVLNLSAANLDASAPSAKDPGKVGYVSLDSCALQPSRMYASVYDTNGALFDLLRSDDEGANWYPLSRTFDDGNPFNNLVYWSNFMGGAAAGGWIKHLSVSPADPDLVAVPGFGGIRSSDGGNSWHSMGATWTKLGKLEPNTKAYHADWHVVRFDPGNPFHRLVATDGGLLNTLGVPPLPWPASVLGPDYLYSTLNSRLFTLQFSSDPPRDYAGESDAESGVAEGLIAGGLQDNGNVYLRVKPLASTPWSRPDYGDGGQNQFFNVSAPVGWLLHSIVVNFPDWNPLVATAILNFPPYVTNVQITPPVKKDPNGNNRPEGLLCLVRAVYRPTHMEAGRRLYAVCGGQASIGKDSFPNSVFGLFASGKFGTNMEWDHLGDLPVAVQSCGSDTGDLVICGGVDGSIYSLDTTGGQVTNMPVNSPFPNATR